VLQIRRRRVGPDVLPDPGCHVHERLLATLPRP
jgi:hypothetical protein